MGNLLFVFLKFLINFVDNYLFDQANSLIHGVEAPDENKIMWAAVHYAVVFSKVRDELLGFNFFVQFFWIVHINFDERRLTCIWLIVSSSRLESFKVNEFQKGLIFQVCKTKAVLVIF